MPISTYTVPSSRLVHETKVDFSYRSVNRTIHVVQYDKQLPIIAVTLYVSGKLYTLPANFDVNVKFGKRDKTFVYKPVLGCNANRTVVYFEMDEQMTFIYGFVSPILELSFVDGENVQRAGSSPIAIEIERNPIQELDIQSTSEYIDLNKAVADAQQAAQDAEEISSGLLETVQEAVENDWNLETIFAEKFTNSRNGWVQVDNEFYVFGGSHFLGAGPEFNYSHEFSKKTYKYNALTKQLTELSDFPIVINELRGVCKDGFIYLIGQDVSSISDLDKTYKYEISTDTYTLITNPPVRIRNSSGAVLVDNKIYVFVDGYYTDRSYVTTNTTPYIYDISLDSWSVGQPTNIRFDRGYAYFYNGLIYVQRSLKFQAYNPTTDTWITDLTPPTYGLVHTGLMHEYKGRLFIGSGWETVKGKNNPFIQYYDVVEDKWFVATRLEFKNHALGYGSMFLYDNKLYYMGGYSNDAEPNFNNVIRSFDLEKLQFEEIDYQRQLIQNKVLYVNINYADLVALRDSNSLKKGVFYRIIDYETTTTQPETRSAGNLFDIIVQALDEKTLSENAQAIHRKKEHEDKELLTWFEHNQSDPAERFFYVDSVVIEGLTLYRWVSYEELDNDDISQYLLTEKRDVGIGDVVWGYQVIDDEEYANTLDYETEQGSVRTIINVGEGYMSEPGVGGYFGNSKLEAWELKYSLDNDTTRFAWADEVNGKGVIYYMKDEYNNEAPYDFKNIQFKRDSFKHNWGTLTFVNIYFYTFSAYSSVLATGVQGDIEDATIITKQELIERDFNSCYSNVIKPLFFTGSTVTIDVPTWQLNNSIFVNIYSSDTPSGEGSRFGCHSNTIGNNSYNNTIGNNSYNNTIGNNFYNNTIEYNFHNNTIGNNFYNNNIGNNFHNNTIKYGFHSNAIGNSFYNNVIGDNFMYNHVGNDIKYIRFSLDGTNQNRIRYLQLKDGLSGASSMNRLNLYYDGLYHRTYPTTFEIIANGNIVSSWEVTPLVRQGVCKSNNLDTQWSQP